MKSSVSKLRLKCCGVMLVDYAVLSRVGSAYAVLAKEGLLPETAKRSSRGVSSGMRI
jgi:hypothetical protein